MGTNSESGNIFGIGEVEIQPWEFLGGEAQGFGWDVKLMSLRGELEVHLGCQDLQGIQGMIERSVDNKYVGTV